MIESKDLIEETFGITITSIKPCRGGYIIDTSLGKKHLRQCQCSENRILYVHAAKEHLYNKGFTNIDTYLVSLNNKPFIEIDEQNFVITPYYDARECEFSDDADSIKAARALAQMHKLGKGFKYENEVVPSDLGKLPENLGKRYDEILRMRRKAERERGAFDYIYLGCVNKFIGLAEESLALLNGAEYSRLVNKTLNEGVICHHDYSYQNILIKGNTTYIVGFECCCEELRIYDLVNLLRRKMRKCNWDIQKASILLDAYQDISHISKDEIAVMTAMLLFPQKFWRVANKYYNSRRSWAQKNFTGMLEEVIAEYDDHVRFMKQFKKLF